MSKGYEGAENSGPQSSDVHHDQPECGGEGQAKTGKQLLLYSDKRYPRPPKNSRVIRWLFSGVPRAFDSGTLKMKGPNITSPK